MKSLFPLFFLLLGTVSLTAQDSPKYKDHFGFQTVFMDMASGNFPGTVNGVLFFQRSSGQEVILDFQGSKAQLELQPDENEIYDVSTKVYTGTTTSGRTRIKYQTYASANGISMEVNGQWFELSIIDGACDMAIHGLEFTYKVEEETEYLILRVSKPLKLTNHRYLYDTYQDQEYEDKKQSLILLPESTLVFAIKR
ncbi:MAG: hypothetical protein AAFR61_11660 [Bacteroidota bacterium]